MKNTNRATSKRGNNRDNWQARLQGLLGWATLIGIFVSIIAFGANSLIASTLFSFFFLFLFILQVLLTISRGRISDSANLFIPGILYFGVLGWAILQASPSTPQGWHHPFWALTGPGNGAISATPAQTMHAVLRLTAYAAVFWIAFQASRNRKHAQSLLAAFAFFSTTLAIFAIYAVAADNNPILGDRASQAVSATYINRNSYATLAAFGVYANLSLYLATFHNKLNENSDGRQIFRDFLISFFSSGWIYLFGALIGTGALVLTASRGGIAAYAIGAILVFFIYSRKNRNLTTAAWATAGVGIVIFAYTVSGQFFGRLFDTTSEEMRFVVFDTIISNINQYWLFGNGLGSFSETFRPFVPYEAATAEWSRAHNSYLENAWELGVPAAVIFYTALIWICFFILRLAWTSQKASATTLASCGVITMSILHAALDFSLQIPANTAIFGFILGLTWGEITSKYSLESSKQNTTIN